MLITFNLSYLENFFVVFYLSFNFILAPGASAHDRLGVQEIGKCYPQKCVFLRIRAYPQKRVRRSDSWQRKAELSRFFWEMPDESCLYW